MKTGLKLFVWTGFSPDYTDGLAFAIAKAIGVFAIVGSMALLGLFCFLRFIFRLVP